MGIELSNSEQKCAILCDGNIVVNAKPGSGKTFTIIEKIARVLPNLPDFQGIIAISYTNKASNELKQRCNKRGITQKQSFWGTIDSFYINEIIVPFASHLTGKIPEYEVVSEFTEDSEYIDLLVSTYPFTDAQEILLIKALANGIIPLNLLGEIALYLLENVAGVLNYIKSKYRCIFIDEYQDCGSIQHQIFTLLVDSGLTGIAVGDINQAIFGFAKRSPKYLMSLFSRNDFVSVQLNRNYRCHESISEYSLALFGASKKVPTEKRVFAVSVVGNETDIAKQIGNRINDIKAQYQVEQNRNIGILCRSNAIALLISKNLGLPNKVFKEIALNRECSAWGRFFDELLTCFYDKSIYAIDFVEQYFSSEYDSIYYSKAMDLCRTIFDSKEEDLINHENEIVQLVKMIYPEKENKNALAILHETLSDINILNSFAPAKDEEISIMTLHKSKGLEFDVVFHMDMYKYIIPFEPSNEDEREQFLNLHYVGITRAKKACYIMLGTSRYRPKTNDYISATPSSFLYLPGMNERRENTVWT